MTSDFNDGLTQQEFKFLLLKYRSYYRIMHSKNERLKSDMEDITAELKKAQDSLSKSNEDYNKAKSELLTEKTRKLSWKERITGKK